MTSLSILELLHSSDLMEGMYSYVRPLIYFNFLIINYLYRENMLRSTSLRHIFFFVKNKQENTCFFKKNVVYLPSIWKWCPSGNCFDIFRTYKSLVFLHIKKKKEIEKVIQRLLYNLLFLCVFSKKKQNLLFKAMLWQE